MVIVCTDLLLYQNGVQWDLWVRSFSFPGSTLVCGVFFSPGRTWVIICTRSSWKNKTLHTGVDPGKLNERTLTFQPEFRILRLAALYNLLYSVSQYIVFDT